MERDQPIRPDVQQRLILAADQRFSLAVDQRTPPLRSLNMNLTTKEISEITRQSPHSINIARARLRSKFNLTGKETSLQEFLSRYNL